MCVPQTRMKTRMQRRMGHRLHRSRRAGARGRHPLYSTISRAVWREIAIIPRRVVALIQRMVTDTVISVLVQVQGQAHGPALCHAVYTVM